jgi:soluble P-type ATPase
MDYKVKIYVPSLKSFEYFNELKNKEALAISKYIKSNDEYGLSVYLNEFVKRVKGADILDKFFILLQLRALNISNKVIISGKHVTGSDATFKVNLFNFLGRYLEYSQSVPSRFTFTQDNLTIILHRPRNIYFKNFYSLLVDSIEQILIDNEDIFKDKSNQEKMEIILKLNKNTLSNVKTFINSINESSELYFCKPENDISIPTIKISFFGNTLFSLLKTLYKTEISYFYSKFYICLTKMGLSYEDYLRLSFVETDILLNIYKGANKN